MWGLTINSSAALRDSQAALSAPLLKLHQNPAVTEVFSTPPSAFWGVLSSRVQDSRAATRARTATVWVALSFVLAQGQMLVSYIKSRQLKAL